MPTLFSKLTGKKSSSADRKQRESTMFSSKPSGKAGSVPVQQNSRSGATAAPATRRPTNVRGPAKGPPQEPPPAYTAGPNSQTVPEVPFSTSTTDDQFAFLRSFDTIFLIDDSGSMAGSNWRQTQEALKTITPICTEHDANGIDIFFLNHPDSSIYRNIQHASTVHEIFSTVRPGGATPTGQRLNKILKPYLEQLRLRPDTTKPINIIVITDGAASDDVESVIISAAKKLDRMDAPAWQVGIQFFQVGSDPDARIALKQLDDDLREVSGDDDLRDIVDTVPFRGAHGEELTAAGILKTVLGAVVRKIDRRSRELHHRR